MSLDTAETSDPLMEEKLPSARRSKQGSPDSNDWRWVIGGNTSLRVHSKLGPPTVE